LAALVAAAVLLFAAWPRGDQSGALERGARTALATAADFYITLPIEGVIEAARSAPIVSLADDTEIVSVRTDGVHVEAGEVVMELNPADAKKEVDRLEDEVAAAEENVRKSRADGEKQVQNARSGLEKREEALELARVQSQAAVEKSQAEVAFLEKELDVSKGQLDKRKGLYEERLIAITEVEAAEDDVRGQQFSLEAAKRSLERAESDAKTTTGLREMDVEKARIELAQAEAGLTASVLSAKRDLAEKTLDLEEAQERLEGMAVKAPVAGMLLLEQMWEDGERPLRIGDQVHEGQRLANIIDTSEMWVLCHVDEADIEKVNAGQAAEVRVPALGGEPLAGEVNAVANLARQLSPFQGGMPGKKVFSAIIQLTTHEPRLRPGMGAMVEVILEHVKEGIAVPLEALVPDGGSYSVYVSERDGPRRASVTLLKRSNALAAIEGQLDEGDSLVLGVPPGQPVGAGEQEATS
jgi:multidrug resistance efflux pump